MQKIKRLVSLLLVLALMTLSVGFAEEETSPAAQDTGSAEAERGYTALDAGIAEIGCYLTMKGNRLTTSLNGISEALKPYAGSVIVWMDEEDRVVGVQVLSQDNVQTTLMLGTEQDRMACVGYILLQMAFSGIPDEDAVIYTGKVYDIPELSLENATQLEKAMYVSEVKLEDHADFASLEAATDDIYARGISAYLSPSGMSPYHVYDVPGSYHDTDNIYQDLINRLMSIYLATSGCVYWEALTEGLENFPKGIFLSQEEDADPFIIVKGDALSLVLYFQSGTPDLNSTVGWLLVELYVCGAPYQEMPSWDLALVDGRYSVTEGGIDGSLSDENTIHYFLDQDYNLFGKKP